MRRPGSHCWPLLATLASAGLPAGEPGGAEAAPTTGIVVSVSDLASRAGLEALKEGGSAVDAAVATAFVLAVTWPEAGNLGGGGYMLVAPSGSAAGARDSAEPMVIDFRETAPTAARREMFVESRDRTAHRRAGVPGSVAGLALAHRRYGRRPWKDLVTPAARLAGEGFALEPAAAASLNEVLRDSHAEEHAEFRRVYGKPDGGAWKAGDRLVQPDLARSLGRIAEGGAGAFYTGEVAGLIAAEMARGGGLITRDDLAAYQPIVRQALHGTYRGHDVYGVPPSSSGGTTLVEMLNILENFDLRQSGRWSPTTLHLMIEAMRRGYCDRARWLADPAFASIPEKLTSKEYARELARGIDLRRATPSERLAKDLPLTEESPHTTHFSVIDKDHMAVSMTTTLESSYGSRVVVRGGGFLLNDEMNDFNWMPGVTTRSGRIGTEPNVVAPGKRMLSSQSPTIVARDGKPVLITGSPGSRTIINTVLCVVVNVVDFGMDLQEAVDAPRLHHQWFPDRVSIEPALLANHPEAIEKLREMGHEVAPPSRQGDAHSIAFDPRTGAYIGARDHRIIDRRPGSP